MKIRAFIVVCALAGEAACGGTFAHFSFDSNDEDSSGNGRHGTLTDVGTVGNSGNELLSATDPKSNASLFRASFTKTGADTGVVPYGSSAARNDTIERLVIPELTRETLLPAKRGTGGGEDRAVEAGAPTGIYRVRAEIP